MEFKDRLKKLRREKGLSQQALADTIFVSRSAVAKWEAGLGLPNSDSLQNIAEFFGLTVEELSTTEPEKVIVVKNKQIHMQKWVISVASALFAIVLLLILLSVPRVVDVETVSFFDTPSTLLQDEWDWLLAKYALIDIHPEDMTVITVGNLWGKWSLQILPVYITDVSTVPSHGQSIWSSRVYVLSNWSEENFFTRMCNLRLEDFSLQIQTGRGALVSPYVDVHSGNRFHIKYDMHETDTVIWEEAFDCTNYCTNWRAVSVAYSVGTSGDAVEKQLIGENEAEVAQFYWNYTLSICGKDIFVCPDTVITQPYTVNA